jgi:hypothetical protein
MIQSGNLSFTKRTLIGRITGSWKQKEWDGLADGLCELGGGHLAEGLHDWVGRVMWLLSFPWHLPKTEEKHGKYPSGNRVVKTPFVASTWTLSSGQPRLASCASVPLGYAWVTLAYRCAFQVTELRGSPHQLTLSPNPKLEEWNPQIVLNLPFTKEQWSVRFSAKTRGLQHLQLLGKSANSGFPDGAWSIIGQRSCM